MRYFAQSSSSSDLGFDLYLVPCHLQPSSSSTVPEHFVACRPQILVIDRNWIFFSYFFGPSSLTCSSAVSWETPSSEYFFFLPFFPYPVDTLLPSLSITLSELVPSELCSAAFLLPSLSSILTITPRFQCFSNSLLADALCHLCRHDRPRSQCPQCLPDDVRHWLCFDLPLLT